MTVQGLEIVVFAFVKTHCSCYCRELTGVGGGTGGSSDTNQRLLRC